MGILMSECCQTTLVDDISYVKAQRLSDKSKQHEQHIDSIKMSSSTNKYDQSSESIKINESWTYSADHKLQEAVITECIKYNDNKYDIVESGLDLNELNTKTTLIKPFRSTSTSTEKGYDSENDDDDDDELQNVPMPIAINWSKSNISYSNRTRIGHLTPSTSPILFQDIENIITSPLILSPTPDTKDKQYSMEIEHREISKCKSVESCSSIKRIINALQWYSINGTDHDTVYKKMKMDNYGKQIMIDYNHLMDYHLNEENIKNGYHLILIEIYKYVEPCTFISCGGYHRYLKAQNGHQHNIQMYVNTMDGIHSCFMHLAKKI